MHALVLDFHSVLAVTDFLCIVLHQLRRVSRTIQRYSLLPSMCSSASFYWLMVITFDRSAHYIGTQPLLALSLPRIFKPDSIPTVEISLQLFTSALMIATLIPSLVRTPEVERYKSGQYNGQDTAGTLQSPLGTGLYTQLSNGLRSALHHHHPRSLCQPGRQGCSTAEGHLC